MHQVDRTLSSQVDDNRQMIHRFQLPHEPKEMPEAL
jgi:hypothetical protein